MLDVNVTGVSLTSFRMTAFDLMLNTLSNHFQTFTINAAIADAINKPLNHPNGPEHAPFWTSDEERGIIINFASAAAHGLYARCLAYAPGKLAVIGITKCKSSNQILTLLLEIDLHPFP